MKKQRRLFWIALVLTVVLLLATGSAAAKGKETRRDFVGEHFLCWAGDPEFYRETGSPPVEHGRNLPWTGRAESSEEELYRADSEGLQSWNLNTQTRSGGVWGTFVKYVDGGGRWEGTYSGHYINGVSYIKVRGDGKGELEGMKYFASFYPKDPSGTPCDGMPAMAASDVIGVIIDTNH